MLIELRNEECTLSEFSVQGQRYASILKEFSNSWKDRCEAFRGCEPLRNSHVLACKLRIPARHEKSKTVADQ